MDGLIAFIMSPTGELTLVGLGAALLGALRPWSWLFSNKVEDERAKTHWLSAIVLFLPRLLIDLLDIIHTKKFKYYGLILALLTIEAFFAFRAATVYYDVLAPHIQVVELMVVVAIVFAAIFLCGYMVVTHEGDWDWRRGLTTVVVVVHDCAGTVWMNYAQTSPATGHSASAGQFDWLKLVLTIGMCALSFLPFIMGWWAEELRPQMAAEQEEEVEAFTSAATRKIKRRAVDRVLRLVNHSDVVHLVRALPAGEFTEFKAFVMPIIAPGKPLNLDPITEAHIGANEAGASEQTPHTRADDEQTPGLLTFPTRNQSDEQMVSTPQAVEVSPTVPNEPLLITRDDLGWVEGTMYDRVVENPEVLVRLTQVAKSTDVAGLTAYLKQQYSSHANYITEVRVSRVLQALQNDQKTDASPSVDAKNDGEVPDATSQTGDNFDDKNATDVADNSRQNVAQPGDKDVSNSNDKTGDNTGDKDAAGMADKNRQENRRQPATKQASSTSARDEKIRQYAAKHPGTSNAKLATKFQVSERTIQRALSSDVAVSEKPTGDKSDAKNSEKPATKVADENRQTGDNVGDKTGSQDATEMAASGRQNDDKLDGQLASKNGHSNQEPNTGELSPISIENFNVAKPNGHQSQGVVAGNLVEMQV